MFSLHRRTFHSSVCLIQLTLHNCFVVIHDFVAILLVLPGKNHLLYRSCYATWDYGRQFDWNLLSPYWIYNPVALWFMNLYLLSFNFKRRHWRRSFSPAPRHRLSFFPASLSLLPAPRLPAWISIPLSLNKIHRDALWGEDKLGDKEATCHLTINNLYSTVSSLLARKERGQVIAKRVAETGMPLCGICLK